MRGHKHVIGAARGLWQLQRPRYGIEARRAIRISATPTTEAPNLTGDVLSNAIDGSSDPAGKMSAFGRCEDVH